MLDKFGPDVIKTAEAVEKYAQDKGYWPKQKEWNQHAAKQGFYSAETLTYWGLWDYLQKKISHKPKHKIIKEVSVSKKSISKPKQKIAKEVPAAKESFPEPISKQLIKKENSAPPKYAKRNIGAANVLVNPSQTNLRKIRKASMPTKDFLKLTGLSKTRLSEIESGTSYIYNDQIALIADVLKTTPEIISKGLLVWDKDRPLPFRKKDNAVKVNKLRKEAISRNKLSLMQQDIIDFIREYPHQYPPTIREIASGVGLNSTSTVHQHLVKLEEKGYVVRKNNSPRCVVIKEKL